MRGKSLNDPTLFFHFCNCPPFEEEMDLHLNKLELPSCKKCQYKVWLKLGWCFILKYSFQYTNVKIVSPLVSPTLTLVDHNLYKRKICTISESCHVNISYSVSVVLKGKFSMTSPIFFAFLGLSPLWKGPSPLFEQFRIPFNHLKFPLPNDDLFQVWLKLGCGSGNFFSI
jgi:hypothetical protein